MLVLDLPAGSPDLGQGLHRLLRDRMIGDSGILVENLSGLVGHRQLKPVQGERIVRVSERKILHEAVGECLPNDLLLSPGFFDHPGPELAGAGEVLDPLVRGGMGGGLADQKDMETGSERLLAVRLVAVEGVSQEGEAPWRIVGSPPVDSAGACGHLAILFGVTILGNDELRRKRHDPGLSGSDQSRSHGDVSIKNASVRMVGHVAGRAMNSTLRGVDVGAVHRQGNCSEKNPVALQSSLVLQFVSHGLDERRDLRRRDRIKNVPDLDIRGNVMDAEERVHVAAAGRSLQGPLEREKGGTLGEEHRKCRAGGIVHRILRIVPGLSGILKVPETGGNPVDKALGLAGRGVRSRVRNPKDIHAPQNA